MIQDTECNLNLFTKYIETILESIFSLSHVPDATDSSCRDTLQQTLLLIYKNQNPSDFSEFIIESEKILVETLTVPLLLATDQSSVFDGVLVACMSHKYFDFLAATKGDKAFFNIVLLNTVVYGDSFGEPKVVKIKEVFQSSDIVKPELSHHCQKKLKDFNVQLIFHRGDLSLELINYCQRENIHCIPVADYEILFKIHQATEASIIFDIGNDLNEADISRICVVCHTVDQKVASNINKRRVSLQSPLISGYIQVLNSPSNASKQYSVIISGRGEDLMLLERERFHDALNRVVSLLRNKQLLRGGETFERTISDLIKDSANYTEESTCYEMTPWVRADVKLFWDLCKEQLEDGVFRKFDVISNSGGNLMVTDVQFKMTLWKDSFECVDRLLTTVSVVESL